MEAPGPERDLEEALEERPWAGDLLVPLQTHSLAHWACLLTYEKEDASWGSEVHVGTW